MFDRVPRNRPRSLSSLVTPLFFGRRRAKSLRFILPSARIFT